MISIITLALFIIIRIENITNCDYILLYYTTIQININYELYNKLIITIKQCTIILGHSNNTILHITNNYTN